LLEEQQQRAGQPELALANEVCGPDERRFAAITPEEVAQEECDELFWERLFRNQVRQVLHALMKYTRFAAFSLPPAELLEVAQAELRAAHLGGTLTLGEMLEKNDARVYSCVQDVRQDFREIQASVAALFPDPTDPSERKLRAYASELVDKAEVKLDCIDEEVIRNLAQVRERGERRRAALQRQQQQETSRDEASQRSRGRGKPHSVAQAMASNPACSGRPVDQHPGDLPMPLADAINLGVKELLETFPLPGASGECTLLSAVLDAGRRIQRGLSVSLVATASAQQGQKNGGHQARKLMKQLTDDFAKGYASPLMEGATVPVLLARRSEAFHKWAKARVGKAGGGGASPALVRQVCGDIVAAFLREERPPGRPVQPVKHS